MRMTQVELLSFVLLSFPGELRGAIDRSRLANYTQGMVMTGGVATNRTAKSAITSAWCFFLLVRGQEGCFSLMAFISRFDDDEGQEIDNDRKSTRKQ